MKRFLTRWMLVSLLGAGVVLHAQAADKGKPKKEKKEGPSAEDFFGDLGGGSKKKGADDLGAALQGMKAQEAPTGDLAPRSQVQKGSGAVVLKDLFVAPTIMMTQDGCVRPREGMEVKRVEATGYPFILQTFSVCARLESDRNRPATVVFKIVTPKGRLVGTSAEQTVDFRGRKQVDHVVDFGEMPFPAEGQYFYRLEVEGATMGQKELFELVTRERAPPPPSVNDLISE